MSKRYYLEYCRPDGWWLLQTYKLKSNAEKQMAIQLENYPGALYRVRPDTESVIDLAEEDER